MDTLNLQCHPNSTLFDRLRKLADERNLPVEELALEAVAEFLGDYGLKPVLPNFPPKTLEDVAYLRGLTKTPGRILETHFPQPGGKEEVCQSTTLRAHGPEQ